MLCVSKSVALPIYGDLKTSGDIRLGMQHKAILALNWLQVSYGTECLS